MILTTITLDIVGSYTEPAYELNIFSNSLYLKYLFNNTKGWFSSEDRLAVDIGTWIYYLSPKIVITWNCTILLYFFMQNGRPTYHFILSTSFFKFVSFCTTDSQRFW